MEHVVVIGKADEQAVRAEDMDVASAAQRARSVRRSDIHRVQVAQLAVMRNHPLTMMKIVVPVCIRIFRTVDKHVFLLRGMNGHHADMRAVSGAINHLHLTRADVDPLDGFTGERRT